MVAIVREKFPNVLSSFDNVEPLGKLHPLAVDLDIDQRGILRRGIVIERIHRVRTHGESMLFVRAVDGDFFKFFAEG